jgi:hypothetical protein
MKDPTMLHGAPIGVGATGKRHETHSMGGIDVPADRYWGDARHGAIARQWNGPIRSLASIVDSISCSLPLDSNPPCSLKDPRLS